MFSGFLTGATGLTTQWEKRMRWHARGMTAGLAGMALVLGALVSPGTADDKEEKTMPKEVREGVLKTLRITDKHLKELYGNPPYRFSVYDSANLSQVRTFALSDGLELMVMTIDAFARARLITADQDAAEITHEALLRAWPRLRGWIDADRAGLYIHQQLTEAAQQWDRDGRSASGLYRDTTLAVAQDWDQEPDHHDDLGLETRRLAGDRRDELGHRRRFVGGRYDHGARSPQAGGMVGQKRGGGRALGWI